ncbi:MAG: hypothetical protein C4574_06795 [Candidatus Latescibacterota bacterium]|nr:MAG: hypothetical protein C4574_06795 [Candidatus Latescibacterota bacterium]
MRETAAMIRDRLPLARSSLALAASLLAISAGCSTEETADPKPQPPPVPLCEKIGTQRVDAVTPAVVVPDWGEPRRLGAPVNTPCPQDAIEIARDGSCLYVMYTEDVLENMPPERILARRNNTYRLRRIGGPGEFGEPEYYDLGKGTTASLDGELSFSPDGNEVYFHSLRSTNQGYLIDPPADDFLDIYVAGVADGEPGPGRNLGLPPNSIHPDGEHALHPDGASLYFGSHRPGGAGGADIWISTREGNVWSEPANLGSPVNSFANDYQPAFTADGDTMYFASGRNPLIGMAIYRSVRDGAGWGDPQLVIRGLVGEPSLTADGRLLYFVHVLSDAEGNYDSDVWYCERPAP